MYLFCTLILLNKDLYESGFVGLRVFTTKKKKNQTQNNTHGLDWIHGLDNFFLITIVIKLSIRTIPNQHKLFEKNLRFEFYLGGGGLIRRNCGYYDLNST